MDELTSITGLHDAIIGVSTRNGVDKVLVYDRDHAKDLLLAANWTENKIFNFFDHAATEKLGELAPLFVTINVEAHFDVVDRPTIH